MSEEKQYPPLPQQGKNLAKFTWDILKSSLTNRDALLVSDEIYNQRLEICKSCEWYDETQNRCKECGCWLEQKARWSLDSCPQDKWVENGDAFINEHFDTLANQLLDKDKESE